jgi:hypothetical protein
MSINTPALLFPAISLLLLAYTNRFLAIASLIRNLHRQYQESHDELLKIQIASLRKRLILIRNMQVLGTLSLFLCVLAMFMVFSELLMIAQSVFGVILVMMLGSLGVSVWELFISVKALNVQLQDIEMKKKQK